jgi:hypothetical protein
VESGLILQSRVSNTTAAQRFSCCPLAEHSGHGGFGPTCGSRYRPDACPFLMKELANVLLLLGAYARPLLGLLATRHGRKKGLRGAPLETRFWDREDGPGQADDPGSARKGFLRDR